MSDSTIGQRFTQLIQQLGISKNAFAQSLDRTATVVQHLVDERNKPGYDLLCRVFEVYPNVSKDWLLLGNGPMLLNAGAPALFTATATTSAAGEAIDLASLAGQNRRRVASTALQPAEIAATVALAASQAANAAITNQGRAQADAAPSQNAEPLAANAFQPSAAAPALASPAVGILPFAPAAPDPAYLTALLQAQYVQHQLALSEQRNQHLLEQQQLLQQIVQLLQRAS